MGMMKQIVTDICAVCQPQQIVLFAEKRNLCTGALKSSSICVITRNQAPNALRAKLYLALTVDMPVSIHVYTADQWRELLTDSSSYASFIQRKGQVLYESKT